MGGGCGIRIASFSFAGSLGDELGKPSLEWYLPIRGSTFGVFRRGIKAVFNRTRQIRIKMNKIDRKKGDINLLVSSFLYISGQHLLEL